ncbi:Gfo/Idh/MocA family oxidoreductase [Macrococcus equipercicus]|uniref:Gfo/Idh/MocA family oxidoreductase n=1 Tax=Macrococcus equipercicus TaxID=69967 RepID=A0ABQ6R9C0_9STAP|nr:Gfo/Idh/MocA family oxidoreductase [Macrococcus equipercicus]KAA1039726.1 Gfo/Idh/MocA family oxidoreductase [Macrococcus equipercicus]
MMTIKVGIIGCGSIAVHRHIPEYQENDTAEIVAFCDINKQRSDELAQTYGGTSYSDYNELLADDTVEAVSICTPNYLHAEMTIAALNAGKHVLCEKPMATSLDDADKMIVAAEKSGAKLMISHNQRLNEAHQAAKQDVAAGKLGKIYSFKTTFGHPGPEGWSVDGPDSWFFDKKRAFIGAMGDLGVHKADLMRYILGEEFKEVGAMIETSAKAKATVDDNAVLILKSTGGIIGTLSASWAYNGEEDNSTVLYGEKGVLKLNADPDYSYIFIGADGEVDKQQLGEMQTNDEDGQVNSHTIDAFIQSIIEDTVPICDGEEGRASLNIILKAIEAAETNTITRF